jgi:hypothetical protein
MLNVSWKCCSTEVKFIIETQFEKILFYYNKEVIADSTEGRHEEVTFIIETQFGKILFYYHKYFIACSTEGHHEEVTLYMLNIQYRLIA